MMSEAKKFIAFGDILAFRFRCKREGCGAELLLPLEAKFHRDKVADSCPNCGANWLAVEHISASSSIAPALERIVGNIQEVSRWPGQFELTLEVKPEEKE
jgi:hypothetical protein